MVIKQSYGFLDHEHISLDGRLSFGLPDIFNYNAAAPVNIVNSEDGKCGDALRYL